ncbi:MAG: hypothetical protein GY940_46490 [bacterium]|nr:hypothetical protein [bacterium]
MAEKAAIIFNPSSGRGKALRKKNKVIACLDAKGIQYDMFVTQSEVHLVETVIDVISRYKTIIGAGGDTTINIIAHEILRQGNGNTLGIISLGSTNDLAREIGVLKLERACNAIAAGTTRAIDVGRITTSHREDPYTFLAQASLGLGVSVNRYVVEWMEKHRLASRFPSSAQVTAGMAGIYNSFKTKIIPIKFQLETSTNTRSIDSSLLILNNTSFVGARFKPSPWASPIDGKLDCCIFNSSTFRHLLKTALQINSRKHLLDNKVEVFQDNYFKIHAPPPFEFQVDGEVVQSDGEIEISVNHQALNVLIEPGYCTEALR